MAGRLGHGSVSEAGDGTSTLKHHVEVTGFLGTKYSATLLVLVEDMEMP